jgi:hypothetical protein
MNKPSLTTLRPPWVYLARVGWLLFATACLLLFVIGTINTARAPLPSCAAPDANCSASTQITREDVEIAASMGLPFMFPLSLIGSLIARLSLALVGALLFWRKSDDWVALLISGALMSVLLEGVQGLDESLHGIQAVVLGIGTALFLPIPFIFPTGRFEPRWVRWPVIAITIPYVILVAFFLEDVTYASLTAVVTLAWIGFSAYSLPYRYFKVASPAERQQIKWVVLGFIATFCTSLYYVTIINLYPVQEPSEGRIVAMLINMPLYAGGYGFFAFSFLFAITRYRLWDTDLIIRRTLQYSLLSGLLALAYAGLVIVLQSLLSAVGSQRSELVTVASTLAIAALFFPLRNRVQEFVDKRFFRKKYDAQKVLAEFAATCRDETDLDKLVMRLEEVIDETLKPDKVSVWIKSHSDDSPLR